MAVGTKRWLSRNFRKVSNIPVCASCRAQVLGSMVPTVDSLSTTNWLDSGLNYCECLGEIYIAIPRQLVDTKKTFGRLYLTVFDFSLLQRIIGDEAWWKFPENPGFMYGQNFKNLSLYVRSGACAKKVKICSDCPSGLQKIQIWSDKPQKMPNLFRLAS